MKIKYCYQTNVTLKRLRINLRVIIFYNWSNSRLQKWLTDWFSWIFCNWFWQIFLQDYCACVGFWGWWSLWQIYIWCRGPANTIALEHYCIILVSPNIAAIPCILIEPVTIAVTSVLLYAHHHAILWTKTLVYISKLYTLV